MRYSDFTVGKDLKDIAQGELFVVNDFLYLQSELGPIQFYPSAHPYLVDEIVVTGWDARVHRDGAITWWYTKDTNMRPRRLSTIVPGVLYSIRGRPFLGIKTARDLGGIGLVDVKTGRYQDTHEPREAIDTLYWSIRQIADGKVLFRHSPEIEGGAH